MKTSIVIPTFNSAQTISETLDSVINQTVDNWECIIVDDGSNDETKDIISSYLDNFSEIQFYQRDKNPKGVSTCRNIGIQKAKGEWLLFLDADDLLSKECLKNRTKFALNNPENDFWVFKMQEFISEIGDIDRIHNTFPEVETQEEYLKLFIKGINPFSVTSPLWRTKTLIKLDGFNEKLQLWEDPELHIRSILEGMKFKAEKSSSPDCFYRNDRTNKKELYKNSQYLKKLYKNTYTYYNLVCKSLTFSNIKTINLNQLLLLNIANFIQFQIIEKRNVIQFINYYFLLLKNNLVSFKQSVIMISWFLFSLFNIEKMGKWSKNSLRKRMFYLISKP